MPDETRLWTLERFFEGFDSWVERESPPDDLRIIVMDWMMTRQDDPYWGVRREPDIPNLWFGRVPNTADGAGNVVVCSYWVHESERRVVCNSFATLSPAAVDHVGAEFEVGVASRREPMANRYQHVTAALRRDVAHWLNGSLWEGQ